MRDQASLHGARPGTYDMKRVVALLCDLLSERKLLDAKLGFEFDFLPTSDFHAFRAALPKAEFCDSSALFRELRLLKEPEEIALLRTACELTEVGISHVVDGLTAGLSAFEMSVRYRSSVMEEAARRGVTQLEALWGFNTFGAHTFGRASAGDRLQPGDGVKFDCGCTLDGYTSDIGRTFVFGKGNKHQRRIQQALIEAWEAGLQHFRPGGNLRSVHHAAQETMRKLGYPAYTRGHVGHGIGSSVWLEEWPYISGDADLIIQPNMVFSYELPYYINGIGSFIIEDQLVIAEKGPQSMNALPKSYLEVS
jgi:Xaa-Pro aminopeptidase